MVLCLPDYNLKALTRFWWFLIFKLSRIPHNSNRRLLKTLWQKEKLHNIPLSQCFQLHSIAHFSFFHNVCNNNRIIHRDFWHFYQDVFKVICWKLVVSEKNIHDQKASTINVKACKTKHVHQGRKSFLKPSQISV